MDWTITDIAGRRIEKLLEKATVSGDASAWRAVRDLAAAYGRDDIAAAAHRAALSPRAPKPATRSEASLVVKSLTPLARRAWLVRAAEELDIFADADAETIRVRGDGEAIARLLSHGELATV